MKKRTATRVCYALISGLIIGLIIAAMGGERLAIVGAVICLGCMATLIALPSLFSDINR